MTQNGAVYNPIKVYLQYNLNPKELNREIGSTFVTTYVPLKHLGSQCTLVHTVSTKIKFKSLLAVVPFEIY
jgi:hypothetical protein